MLNFGMEIRKIPVERLIGNEGQIPGLPKNPRFIKDRRFEKLVKSIMDHPEMLELRELIVVPFYSMFVIIAGNMRHKAALEIGIHEMICKVLPVDTPVETLRAITIKDNVSFGEDDEDLLVDWDEVELHDFGMDMLVETEPERKPRERVENPNDAKAEFEVNGEFNFENNELKPFRTLLVHFGDQDAVDRFKELLEIQFGDGVKFTYYPPVAPEPLPEIYELPH